MERAVVILAVVVGGAALFGASTPSPVSSARAAEVMRLERHFDSVDLELRSRDVSGLNVTQRANRAQLVSWLRDYRNADRFPVNDRFAQPTPFFRDKDGVLCAMAYLIDRSGRGDIVDKVAATRNNAYISQLADDPALIAWLDTWGLTVAEAGRIQPSYGGGDVIIDDDDDVVDSDVALGAIGLGGSSLATTAVNIVKPSTASGILGVLAGVGSIIFGAVNLDDDEYSGNDQVSAVTIGLGALSVGAGIYGYLEAQHHRDRYRDRFDTRRRRGLDLKVVPDLAVQRSEPRVGLLVNGRF